MKHLLATAILLISFLAEGLAQSPVIEGTSYYLPKTAVQFTILVEKKTFTPGELSMYANRYFMQGDEVLTPKVTHRIVNMKMEAIGVPDTAKYYTAKMSPKLNINKVYTTDDAVLLAVNTEPKAPVAPVPFKAAPKKAPLNPRDFMSAEILAVGSKAKMAQLCAKEIYDIREARNELTRGQADAMPKDGEQLRLMMVSMEQQEKALTQLFCGITECDTIEEVITLCPDTEVERRALFRFSEYYGVCDADDLSGAPYYVSVKDLHQTPEDTRTEKEKMKQKDETGLFVNVAGRAHVSVYQQEKLWVERDYPFAQFGRTENLSTDLFNKKVMTTYEVNPVTGAMVNMKSDFVN